MTIFQKSLATILALCLLLFTTTSKAENASLRTQVTGVDGEILANVNTRLTALQASSDKELTPNKVQAFFKLAPSNIKKALEPFGYFKATIQQQLTHHGNIWIASFHITPGLPLRITQLDVQISGPGETDIILQKLLKDFPLASGQIFQTTTYEKAKQALFESANDQGYLKASLTKKEIIIDLEKYTVIIRLHLSTGPRYYFGFITFDQKAFSEKFLRRFLPFQSDEPYSGKKLLAFQQNLNNSRFFREVNVNPNIEEAKDFHVPVEVGLIPNKSQQYNAGIGYGTFTGPRLTLGMNFRHLTQTGHHFNMQIKLSPILSGLAGQYVIPGRNPMTDEYTLGANMQRFLPKNGYSISKTFSAAYVKKIREWKNTFSLNYLHENSFITGQPASYNSRILYPSFTVSRVKADDLVNPRHGSKVDLTLRGANDHAISNISFLQSEIKAKYIYGPTEYSRIIVRGDVGYTVVKDLTAFPISLQFYSGGLDSVRGYPTSYEGPARYLKVASVELQHRIVDKWNGAVFYDAGTASNHFNTPLDRSVGLGLIYNSIVGPIKVYVARQLSRPGHPLGLEFSIGPDL